MEQDDAQKVDIYKPKFVIAIRTIDDDFSWYSWFRANNLKGMVYAFYYKNKVLKFGCSFCKFKTRKNDNFGDRLIRQVNNLPGRFKLNPTDWYEDGYGFLPKSPNGREMVKIIKDFEKNNNIKVDRDDIYLHIWDITNVESEKYFWADDDEGNKKRAEYFEALVVVQYKSDNDGQVPLGNVNDPSTRNHAYTKPKISKEGGSLFF